jgi:hypothetical protein
VVAAADVGATAAVVVVAAAVVVGARVVVVDARVVVVAAATTKESSAAQPPLPPAFAAVTLYVPGAAGAPPGTKPVKVSAVTLAMTLAGGTPPGEMRVTKTRPQLTQPVPVKLTVWPGVAVDGDTVNVGVACPDASTAVPNTMTPATAKPEVSSDSPCRFNMTRF